MFRSLGNNPIGHRAITRLVYPPYMDTARRMGLAGRCGAWHALRPPRHVSLGGHVATAMATRDADLPNQGNCVDGRAGEEGALSVRRAAVRNTDVTFGPADPLW